MINTIGRYVRDFIYLGIFISLIPLVFALFLALGALFLFKHPIWAIVVAGIGIGSQFRDLKKFFNSRAFTSLASRILALFALIFPLAGAITVIYGSGVDQIFYVLMLGFAVLTFPLIVFVAITKLYFPASSMARKIDGFIQGIRTVGAIPYI